MITQFMVRLWLNMPMEIKLWICFQVLSNFPLNKPNMEPWVVVMLTSVMDTVELERVFYFVIVVDWFWVILSNNTT